MDSIHSFMIVTLLGGILGCLFEIMKAIQRLPERWIEKLREEEKRKNERNNSSQTE